MDAELTWQDLTKMGVLTDKFGFGYDPKVENVQRLQLGYWSRLAVPEASTTQVEVDAEHKALRIAADVAPGTRPRRDFLDGFARSVDALLGPGWKIEVREARVGGWTWRRECQMEKVAPSRRRTRGRSR